MQQNHIVVRIPTLYETVLYYIASLAALGLKTMIVTGVGVLTARILGVSI